MKIKKIENDITSYQISENFFVDMQTDETDEEFTSFYIYHRKIRTKAHVVDIKIKDYMNEFGLTTLEEVIEHLICDYDMYYYYRDYIIDDDSCEKITRRCIENDFDIEKFE